MVRGVAVTIVLLVVSITCWVNPASGATDPTCPDAGEESHSGCEDPIAGSAAPFDMWELARSWTPGFCGSAKKFCSKKECDPAETEPLLTLHGMWPSYSSGIKPSSSLTSGGDAAAASAAIATARRSLRAKSAGGACFWPQDCSKPSWYPTSSAWEYDESLLPKGAAYEKLAPAWYEDGLGVHEWSKHGTCGAWLDASGDKPGLDQAGYYNAMFDLANKEGTPAGLVDAMGGVMPLADLQALFGGPTKVALGCTPSCELVQVLTCYSQGSEGAAGPAAAAECPCVGVRDSHYDNSCAQEHMCDAVKILSPDQTGCGGEPGPGPGPGPGPPSPVPPGCGTTKCCAGIKGPPCTTDTECAQFSDCLRCAHSGHCTDVPLTKNDEPSSTR